MNNFDPNSTILDGCHLECRDDNNLSCMMTPCDVFFFFYIMISWFPRDLLCMCLVSNDICNQEQVAEPGCDSPDPDPTLDKKNWDGIRLSRKRNESGSDMIKNQSFISRNTL